MKRTSFFGIAAISVMLILGSCAPQAFVINPEMRQASKSGMNLAGKSIGIVYLTGSDGRQNAFNASSTSAFATKMEEDYFGGEEVIELFRMPLDRDADYSSKDSLVSLIMQTGKDVVFLFDIPEYGEPSPGDAMKIRGRKMPDDSTHISQVKVPVTTKVYVYDSMDRNLDKVMAFSGSKVFQMDVYSNGKESKEALAKKSLDDLSMVAEASGKTAANTFISTWAADDFYVIYYDASESAWNRAAEYSYTSDWKNAISQWLTLVDHRNKEKRSCAAYNIALGCFMMGQPELALEWLDRSDKEMPINLSKVLRSKIEKYTGQK